MTDRRVIANRASALVASASILWAAALLLGFLTFKSLELKDSFKYIVFFAVILICAVVNTVTACRIPPILIEYADGVLCFYPNKRETVTVRPQDIRFISQTNYSGRGISYSFGKMNIELNSSEVIKLRWVSDIESVRRALEELKNNVERDYNKE